MIRISDIFLKPNYWNEPSQSEIEIVRDLLGKVPQGEFQIVARNSSGEPSVIENAPFFYDGTPMPTRYWLVDPDLVMRISRLESTGGVKFVQQEIEEKIIKAIHEIHEKERNKLIADSYDGPKPTGGVGGTRKGVKCLHTHVANYLATGEDEIGKWTMKRIEENE